MATFPSYARIILPGYSETPDYGVLRSDMDGGIAKQRARWSRPIVTRDVQILVRSRQEKLLLDEWMREELAGGAGWFDYYDCLDEKTKQARIVAGRIQWSSPGVVWIGQAQIESIG